MRIVQILQAISFGDAVSNHVRELDKYFKKVGQETATFCPIPSGQAVDFYHDIHYYSPREDDIILYHLSVGCDLNKKVIEYKVPIIIYFHNITPPDFFRGYNKKVQKASEKGYSDLNYIKEHGKNVIGVISASEFSSNTLVKMGFKCPLYNLPIMMDFSDYYFTKADLKVLKLKKEDYTNLVFVGRVCPHKKQQDILLSFYYYQKYFNTKSRLFLVGHYFDFEKYYLQLIKYVKMLGMKNVYITGQVSFQSIIGYYKIADIFLCESEHEGFCVPLVEAMIFHVPIIAFDSSAVGETLGNAGILFKNKDPRLVASIIDSVYKDEKIKNEMLSAQKERLRAFDKDVIGKKYLSIITHLYKNYCARNK